MFNFEDIARITGGSIVHQVDNREIKYLISDTRKIFRDKRTVFVAIRGVRHDGHTFVKELIDSGIEQFIIEDENYCSSRDFTNCNVLWVKNSIEAVQYIATAYRQLFSIDILGITGSNGKTIVKEWLSQMLSGKYRISRSPKSYNSQLGVPLSVMQMESYHSFGIFEAGISKPGEMEKIERILKPSLGIFTNIGPAHDEGFQSRTEKATEKWKLFSDCRTVVYCKDHAEVDKTCPLNASATFTWGSSEDNNVQVLDIKKTTNATEIELKFADKTHHFRMPYVDAASIENALHCTTACLYLGLSADEIQTALSGLIRVSMRLELKKGINGCYLVDDSYSNDLSGLEIALDFLNQQPQKRSTVVLSDILQSGLKKEQLYATVNDLLENKETDRLIGIGPEISSCSHLFGMEKYFYPDTDTFIEQFDRDLLKNESILVKGARVFEFEKVVRELTQKAHGTVLEINLDAITHNLNYYRSLLNSDVKIMGMVKAFAYGSGSYEVANLLQFHRIDYLGVAYADEGVALRKQGITLPIMVMNTDQQVFELLENFDLEPEVYSTRQLRQLIAYFSDRRRNVNIHLKIDTGMHRLGFEEEELASLIDHISKNPQLKVVSIYSHLAGADDETHDIFTHEQVRKFAEMAEQIEQALGIAPIKHMLNSPGILRFPEYQFDMVRLGIGLYGYGNTKKVRETLRPISTLKTTISQIRKVEKGETVGYGRRGVAKTKMTIATIAIGYADGYLRAFSNGRARVLINGKFAPVFGTVCMDMTMIDITGISAKEGDEVILFGEKPTIEELAESIGTIPYEILTNVSDRVKRVFFTES